MCNNLNIHTASVAKFWQFIPWVMEITEGRDPCQWTSAHSGQKRAIDDAGSSFLKESSTPLLFSYTRLLPQTYCIKKSNGQTLFITPASAQSPLSFYSRSWKTHCQTSQPLLSLFPAIQNYVTRICSNHVPFPFHWCRGLPLFWNRKIWLLLGCENCQFGTEKRVK